MVIVVRLGRYRMYMKKKLDLKGKRVTVMGLGLHGGAIGNIMWLSSQGAHLIVTDLKTEAELASSRKKLSSVPDINFVLGQHREEDFTKADLVVQNPAVPRTSPYLEVARQAHVPIMMDSSIFFHFCPTSRVIGVTGSKGKTTTANAITHILKAKYPLLVAIGIDGVSPLGELPNILKSDPVVFELSSWRLEALAAERISPARAVVTSIYRDHLNTYDSMADYIEAKKHIIRYQIPDDICLLNVDDKHLTRWAGEIKSQLYWYSLGVLKTGRGIGVRNGVITFWPEDAGQHPGVSIMPIDRIPLASAHERRNVLPAIFFALMERVPQAVIERQVRTLRGLPHRLEMVGSKKGVTYINDSAATMPEATMAALQALADRPIIHILGGSDKNLLFDELAVLEAKAFIKALIMLPGTATERMIANLRRQVDKKVAMYPVKSMPEAVKKAAAIARVGDTVLLSPAATSFGLFQHEFDRGNQFRQAVLDLGS